MPPKAKADNTALWELKHALRDGQLKNLYVFHGEEAYLREYYLGQLKKALLPAGLEEFNLHTAQGKECSPEWLEQADVYKRQAPTTRVTSRLSRVRVSGVPMAFLGFLALCGRAAPAPAPCPVC